MVLSMLFICLIIILVVGTNGIRLSPVTVATPNHLSQPPKQIDENCNEFFPNIKKKLNLLINGPSNIINNTRKALSLRKLQSADGPSAISFDDFKFLEQAKADLRKGLRLFITIPMSPQYFFYSKMLFPMMSPGNPWAWKALPSVFDDPVDLLIREKVLNKRRMQATVLSLHTLLSETIDDIGNPKQRIQRKSHIKRIETALQQKSLNKSMEILNPWLLSSDHNKGKKLQLTNISGNIIQLCLKSLGGDGVPNIPIIRWFNTMELNNKLNNVGKSDAFLYIKGIETLSPTEVHMACVERCISTEKRPDSDLRADLKEWLTLSHPHITSTTPLITTSTIPVITTTTSSTNSSARSSNSNNMELKTTDSLKVSFPSLLTRNSRSTVPNLQNRRLALMALHSVRNLRKSSFGTVYKALFTTNTDTGTTIANISKDSKD